MAEKFKLKTKSTDEINVILLGESGVGKSTFINAISNYLAFDSFDDAQIGKLVTVLPVFFTITDENYKQIKVKIGDDGNEQNATGKAATRNAKTHTVKIKDFLVNIIDTPGIGDPEGFKKDKENLQNIIQYISSYKELNGICILLKPNNARLDLHFRYCFKELLVHLHKKAAPNIVFCFTNTRGTFYTPGDSLPPLEKLVKDVEKESGIQIPLGRENIFCFDNESFRFLAALQQGVKFNETDIDDFSKSWDKSVKSTLDMMAYITKLPIHDIFDTVNLNEARKIFHQLSKPIAELSQNIQINIKLAKDKKKELEELNLYLRNLSLKYLENQLYIEQIDFERVPLTKPRTVCTDHSCTSQIKIGSVDTVDYITHCHSKCYSEGIQEELIGHIDLLNCAAMKSGEVCSVCGHHYTVHMHLMYEYKKKSSNIKLQIEEFKKTQSMIDEIGDKRIILREGIKFIDERIKVYKNEQEGLIQISAEFASFTKKHAIIVLNDPLDSYLDLIIKEEEKCLVYGNNEEILYDLRAVKKYYIELKKKFDQEFKKSIAGKEIEVSQTDYFIDELCKLPLSGDKIKGIVDEIRRNKPKKK